MRWILAALLLTACGEDSGGSSGEGGDAGVAGDAVVGPAGEGDGEGDDAGGDDAGGEGGEGEGQAPDPTPDPGTGEGEGEPVVPLPDPPGEGEGEGEGDPPGPVGGEGEGEGEGGQVDPVCVDTDLYADADGDGFGVDPVTANQCVVPGEPPQGLAIQSGDCRPNDPWANPDAQEICGDNVDDDCNGADGDCPESRPAAMQISQYDCTGVPENFVLASAHFPTGGQFFADGGCFVIFEGSAGEFYVRHNLQRANPACANSQNGCTCPSLDGRPSYDRRLYAMSLRGTPDDCENLEIIDHGGEDQPVSNDCRKYLYQLHFYDIPFSFFASGQEHARRRIDLFPSVELACLRDAPHRFLPFRSLFTQAWQYNPGYVPQQ